MINTVVLGAVLAMLTLTTFGRATGPAIIAVQGATLLFGLGETGWRRPARVVGGVALALITAALVAAEIASGGHPGRLAVGVTALLGMVIALAIIVLLLRRTRVHLTITVATLNAALSVYLLIGLAYAYLYDFITAATGLSFFHDTTSARPLDYLYFSYITMATVGYGDFTPARDGGRMAAASEAIVGQLYLVTVVALVVGNFGRQRVWLAGRPPPRPPEQPVGHHEAEDPSDPG